MGIYVKTPQGKESLHKKVTASEIKEALGYTPANPDDINIPDVDIDLSDIESNDDTFYIVDQYDNKIVEINAEGLHALNVKIGKDGQTVADMIKAEIPDVDLSNYYTRNETYKKDEVYNKTEADAEFMTQTEVDNRINALINAADPEGGKTISDIQNLVKYVEENAGEITGLIDDIQANAQEIANMKEEIVSDKEEFHIVDDADRIVATIDKNGVQSVAFLDKDGNAFTNLTPLFTHTKKVVGFASEVQTDLGYSAVITLDTKCRSVENVKLLTTNGFNSQEVTISHYEGRITVAGWADSPIKGVSANISYTASHADHADHASSAETCATPTISTHIANKKYVDDEIYKFSSGDNTVKTAQTANALKSGYSVSGAFGSTISVYFNTGRVYVVCVAYQMYNYNGVFINMGGSQDFMLYGTKADEGIKCSYSSTASTISFTKNGESISVGSCYVREI